MPAVGRKRSALRDRSRDPSADLKSVSSEDVAPVIHSISEVSLVSNDLRLMCTLFDVMQWMGGHTKTHAIEDKHFWYNLSLDFTSPTLNSASKISANE